MKSLTVFDPEKVFTEVIKLDPPLYCNGGKAFYPLCDSVTATYVRALQTHKVFLHKKLLCTYL